MLNSFHLSLASPKLFIKKAAGILAAMLVLVPLVSYKLFIPASLYLISLLALHLIFLYFYLIGIPWRQLAASKRGLIARIAGVGVLVYLLTVLSFTGSITLILANLAAALLLHLSILLFLMAEVAKRDNSQAA